MSKFEDPFICALVEIFKTPTDQCSIAHNVPIALRQETLDAFNEEGVPVRLRYRGPRMQSVGRLMYGANRFPYRRTRSQAYQDCLREDATSFSVYHR